MKEIYSVRDKQAGILNNNNEKTLSNILEEFKATYIFN